MSTMLSNIRHVNPDSGWWKVKIMVCDKTQIRFSEFGLDPYQRITFMDTTTQKVVATIFRKDIEFFRDKFKLYETYTIANAKVARLKPRHNLYNYPYQWIIKRRTDVHLERRYPIDRSMLKFHFAPLCFLKNFVGQDIPIDVLAVIIENRGRRPVKVGGNELFVKEYTIINEEEKPVILTLWNDIAESEGVHLDNCREYMPVIRATNLTISKHHGGSLGSTSSTVVVINPDIPEAAYLYAWRLRNLRTLTHIMTARQDFIRQKNESPSSRNNTTPITVILTDDKENQFLVGVHSMKVMPGKRYFYMSCSNCCLSINAYAGYKYLCFGCKRISEAVPREKILVRVCDGTGKLDVTILGNLAARITGMNSITTMEMHYEGLQFPIEDINKSLHNKCFLMKLKKRQQQHGNLIQTQYLLKDIRYLGQPDNLLFHEEVTENHPRNKIPKHAIKIEDASYKETSASTSTINLPEHLY